MVSSRYMAVSKALRTSGRLNARTRTPARALMSRSCSRVFGVLPAPAALARRAITFSAVWFRATDTGHPT